MDPALLKNHARRATLPCLLVMALLLVPSVAAASLFDIDITGQPGNVPWNVADIKPSFHGTGTVTITNPGPDACSILVWVGNITGDRALGQYMLYRVSGPRLETSMVFPATIYDFPQAPDSPRSITVSPVAPGETITLDWTWEFQETGVPQNEAQGKQLGFVVYYTLIAPPPDMSGWYNVTPPEFRQVPVSNDPCLVMNQGRQEYRVYTCTLEGCTYLVTDHRWLDLGTVLRDENGDGICDGDRTPAPTTVPATSSPTSTAPTATPITTGPTATVKTTVMKTTVPTTTVKTTVPKTTVPKTVSTPGIPTVVPVPVPTIDATLCPPLAMPSGPVTVITGPTVITAPGYYALSAGAVNTTAPVFLEVRVSGVTIDGMGLTIDGVDGFGTYGVLVRGDGPLERIIIQNLTTNDFAYGIALFETRHARINRVSATSCTYDGVMVLGGGDNEIVCSLIDRDDDGINLSATTRTHVALNTVTANVRGSGIHVGPGSNAITVAGNLLGANDEGIEVENARGVVIRSNRIYESRYRGLNLTSAEEVTVVDNYLANRENVDLCAGPFSGAWNHEPGPGPNVMGNPSVGGNYWGAPDATGFSDTTPDGDGDGFADVSYVLPDGLGTDFFPLGPALSPSAAGTGRAPSSIDAIASWTELDATGAGWGGNAIAGSGASPSSADPATHTTPPVGSAAMPATNGTNASAGMAAATLAPAPPCLAVLAVLAVLLVAGLVVRRRRK